MADTPQLGMNQTPLAIHPVHARKMLQKAARADNAEAKPTEGFEQFHLRSLKNTGAIGSIPLPSDLKSMVKTGAKKIMGKNEEVLIDKLGERLAFERTGVRLYDALITKFKAADKVEGISLPELEEIRNEELQHFRMLQETMQDLGADPTGVTPSADITGVMGMGLVQVCGDARNNFATTLEAILVAELVDNDGWENLIELAEGMGKDRVAERFRGALDEEEQHLAKVRSWIKLVTKERAGI